MTLRSRSLLISVLVVPAVLALGACGTDGASSTSEPSSLEVPPLAPQDGAADYADAGAPATLSAEESARAAGSDSAQKVVTREPAVISKGQISVHTEDIDAARFEMQKLLDTWDAKIAQEQSDADDQGRTQRARYELRVPSPTFDTAMNALADLGTLVDRSRSAEDVTTQVIDTEARIRSQRLSLARIEALLARADDLNDVIAIETQLSRRQADLDSLEQQQKFLADQTSLATITLYLSVPADQESDEDDDGFWAGLTSGWEHLGAATSATLTAVGTALPFAGVLALIAAPGWLLWRRRTARSASTAVSTPSV